MTAILGTLVPILRKPQGVAETSPDLAGVVALSICRPAYGDDGTVCALRSGREDYGFRPVTEVLVRMVCDQLYASGRIIGIDHYRGRAERSIGTVQLNPPQMSCFRPFELETIDI